MQYIFIPTHTSTHIQCSVIIHFTDVYIYTQYECAQIVPLKKSACPAQKRTVYVHIIGIHTSIRVYIHVRTYIRNWMNSAEDMIASKRNTTEFLSILCNILNTLSCRYWDRPLPGHEEYDLTVGMAGKKRSYQCGSFEGLECWFADLGYLIRYLSPLLPHHVLKH